MTPPITHRTLTVERNLLLAAAVLLFAVNVPLGVAFNFRLPAWEVLGGFGVIFAVLVRLLYVLAVYRVSRFGQQRWRTLVFCVLAIFAGFELIPLAALLIIIARTRGTLDAPAS